MGWRPAMGGSGVLRLLLRRACSGCQPQEIDTRPHSGQTAAATRHLLKSSLSSDTVGNSMSGKPACGFWRVGGFSPQCPRGSVPVPPLPNYMLSHMARGTQWAGLPLRTSGSLSFSLTWLNLGLEDGQANPVPSLGLSTWGRPGRGIRSEPHGCPLETDHRLLCGPWWPQHGWGMSDPVLSLDTSGSNKMLS